MIKFITKRLLFMILAVFVISLITFGLLQMAPGNYLETQRLLQQNLSDSTLSAEQKDAWEQFFELDKPAYERYFKFVFNAFQLKFGPSFKYPNQLIENIISRTLPVSITLALSAIGIALLLGIPLGILGAVNQNKMIDRIAVFFSMIGSSIPSFLLAIIFCYLFGIVLKWLPIIGWGKPVNYVLPIISLAMAPIGTVTKYMRGQLIETMNQEYIKVARAKGGNFIGVVLKHALRNSLIPLVTVVGPMVASLTVGTVFVETLFSIPGMGQYFSSAAINRDYPMVMASTFVFSALVMGTNLLVDLIHAFLDPRVKKNILEG